MHTRFAPYWMGVDPTLNVAIRFAYDTRFAAFTGDPEGDTVEAALRQALAAVGLTPGGLRLGSRTDAAVAAAGNVASATLERPHTRGLLQSAQKSAPHGLWFTGFAIVPPGWEPRHATSRTYIYLAEPSGDAGLAMRAAGMFCGAHDMRAFAKMEERNPIRHVHSFDLEVGRDGWMFTVTGASFLWNQVRRMVGAVLAVASGRVELDAIAAALKTGQPNARFVKAPAEGLLLAEVHYEGVAWQEYVPPALIAARRGARVACLLTERAAGLQQSEDSPGGR